MTQEYEIAAGLDIHKQFLVATILSIHGLKIQQRFDRTMQGLLALKDWVIEHKCQVVNGGHNFLNSGGMRIPTSGGTTSPVRHQGLETGKVVHLNLTWRD